MEYPRIAILNESGKKVVVKRAKDFSKGVMSWYVAEPVAVVEAPVEEEVVAEPAEEVVAEDGKTRFEELKAKRAWLHADTKEEYAKLKAIYG